MLTALVVVFALMVMLYLEGCSSAEDDWKVATEKDTIADYENFVNKHPDSKYSPVADDQIEEKMWEYATKRHVIGPYHRYLNRYPNGKHANAARKEVAQIGQRIHAKETESKRKKWLSTSGQYCCGDFGGWCHSDERYLLDTPCECVCVSGCAGQFPGKICVAPR